MAAKSSARFVVVYDIVSDARRHAVAELLSAYGPRVQLSVFEVELTDKQSLELTTRLADLVDELQDQVRVYPCPSDATVVGGRTLEERASYWIVSDAAPSDMRQEVVLTAGGQ